MPRLPLLLCLLICTAPVLADTPAPSAPPEPERYVDEGQYSEYAREAQAWLAAQPDDAAAPRVSFDLLVAASVFNDQASAIKATKLLIGSYPTSTQTRFIVSTLFKDGSEFAQIMSELADDTFITMPVGFPVKYDEALQLGAARFGASALGDGPALARTFILAQLANDNRLSSAALQILKNGGARDAASLTALQDFLDGSSTPLVRLAKLHALTDRAAATPFENFLLKRLSDTDRASAQVQAIEADDSLASGELDVALTTLTKLNSTDPRLVFWQAWSTAAGGDSASADAQLKKLIAAHPDDPWAKVASQVDPALTGTVSSINQNVEAALAASRSISRGIDLLEGNVDYLRTDGGKVKLYVGFAAGNLLELFGSTDGVPTVGYRATDQDASLFVPGADKLFHFTKPALLPAPRVGLARIGNAYALRADLGSFTYSFDDLAKILASLTASDVLSSRQGLQDLMRNLVHEGICPLPPTTAADGSMTYGWVSPAVTTPDVRQVSFTVDANGSITAYQCGTLSITGIHYGKTGSFALNSPALPKLTVVERGQMEKNVLQAAVPAFYLLFNVAPPPATQPTTQATTQP